MDALGSEEAVWTEIYANFGDGVPTMTRAMALRDDDDRVIAVLGVDLFIEHLQAFLTELDLGTRAARSSSSNGTGRWSPPIASGELELHGPRGGEARSARLGSVLPRAASGVVDAFRAAGAPIRDGPKREAPGARTARTAGSRCPPSVTSSGSTGRSACSSPRATTSNRSWSVSDGCCRSLPADPADRHPRVRAAFVGLVVRPLRQLSSGASRIHRGRVRRADRYQLRQRGRGSRCARDRRHARSAPRRRSTSCSRRSCAPRSRSPRSPTVSSRSPTRARSAT